MNSPNRELDASLRREVLAGLSCAHKELPWKYAFDSRGAELAEAHAAARDAYPTRLELSLLRACSPAIAELVGEGASIVEFGGCDPDRARVILGALKNPLVYMPIDLCARHLWSTAMQLQLDYPFLAVRPINADFASLAQLPDVRTWEHDQVSYLLLGGAIGRFDPISAARLLRLLANLTPRNLMVVGLDLKKPEPALIAAHVDADGYFAELNLNILGRINRELDGDFDLSAFTHEVVWNQTVGRVEVFLRSRARQTVHVAGETVELEAGEGIHTQSAYKYTIGQFHRLSMHAGYMPLKAWTDPARCYSLHVLMKCVEGGTGKLH